MNIFVIEKDQKGSIDWIKSAKSLDNYRVVKMILESCQMLCTTINVQHGKQVTPYKSAYVNHPSTKWVGSSSMNFICLFGHTASMLKEYKERFNKTHKCRNVLKKIVDLYDRDMFDSHEYTQPPMCMPDEFKSNDIVDSYRRFYASKPNMRYPKSKIPSWFSEMRTIDFTTVEDKK